MFASKKRSDTTVLPADSAGAITCCTSCARAAMYRSISVMRPIGILCASRSKPRMASPISVPPGSRQVTTSCPRWARNWQNSFICVDFPTPSIPSKLKNVPCIISSIIHDQDSIYGAFVAFHHPPRMIHQKLTQLRWLKHVGLITVAQDPPGDFVQPLHVHDKIERAIFVPVQLLRFVPGDL